MRKYTRGLSTSTRADLLVPAAETVLTDGRTDVKKKVRFLEISPFGSDGSKPDGYFRTLDAFSVLSDAVRTALSKKRYV